MNKASTSLIGIALLALTTPAIAHHSFAMFSDESATVEGTVLEFKFTNPHTFILLEVANEDGTKTLWNLEGSSPSGLFRRGWTSESIKAGDVLVVEINPLRSGAPGGSWETGTVTYADGTPVIAQ